MLKYNIYQLILSAAKTVPKWITNLMSTVITHAGIADDASRAFSRVCLSVRLFVRALTGKWLELLSPNLVHVYPISVTRHALIQRSKGQRPRSHDYENRHGRTVAIVTMPRIP